MTPSDFLEAARVPETLQPQEFGPWTIERLYHKDPVAIAYCGWPTQTLLRRMTLAKMHVGGDIVMEDSQYELRRHLPIWLAARGRVLITGLGLGCVLRGLLASPRVEHVDVVECDADIIRVVGAEFVDDQRCAIHHANAMTWTPPIGVRWDFAWHDCWVENDGLQFLHAELFKRFADHVDIRRQGAWQFPRRIGRRIGLLGAPRLKTSSSA